MDLFNVLSDELESSSDDVAAQVIRACDFVKELNERQLNLVKAAQGAREFEAWEKASRGLQSFAFKQGLREEWWATVQLVKDQRAGSFWTAGWDAVFDYSIATLLKPWAGKSYSAKTYELMVAPLEAAGFKG